MGKDIWQTLEIPESADAAEIRRAYARKLKALDVDADPGAFAELREARDYALGIAAGRISSADHERKGSPDSPGGGFNAYGTCSAPIVPFEGDVSGLIGVTVPQSAAGSTVQLVPGFRAANEQPECPLTDPDWSAPSLQCDQLEGVIDAGKPIHFAAHDQAIWEMLLGAETDPQSLLTEEELESLCHNLERLLNDPQMASVSHYANVEQWLAEVLARSVPRSDPALVKVADFFGWQARAGTIGQAPAIEFINQRLSMFDFMAAVQQPGHRLHRAWRELIRPANEHSKRGMFVRSSRVAELISTIRKEHPALEASFDWYRVAMWEGDPGFSLNWGWVLATVLFVLHIGFRLTNPSEIDANVPAHPSGFYPESTAVALTDERQDIETLLRVVFASDYTIDELKATNPDFYEVLKWNWQISAQSGATRGEFIDKVGGFLMERFDRSFRTADETLLLELHQLHLKLGQSLQTKGADACDRYFQGNAALAEMPADLVDKQRQLILRILLNVPDVQLQPPDDTFQLSARVVDAIAARAGLSQDQLATAMQGGGTSDERCKARLSLISTVLELPEQERRQLIRTM